MRTRLLARPRVYALLAAFAWLLSSAGPSLSQTYSFTAIDTNGSNFGYVGEAINSSGEAAVKYLDFNYQDHILLFLPVSPNTANGTITNITSAPAGYTISNASDSVAINDSGTIAFLGYDANAHGYIIVWQNPQGGGSYSALPLPNGLNSIGNSASGVEINNFGQVVASDGTHVYVWTSTSNGYQLTTLSPTLETGYQIMSTGLDNEGNVVAEASGSYLLNTQMEVFWWSPATANGPLSDPPVQVVLGLPSTDQILPAYPGAVPMNDSGRIGIEDVDSNLNSHLYALDLNSGALNSFDIGPFSFQRSIVFGSSVFEPAAINNTGSAAAVLYGGIIGPFAVSTSNLPVSLDGFGTIQNVIASQCPVAINDVGQIVADGALYTPPGIVTTPGPTVKIIAPLNGRAFSTSVSPIYLEASVSPVKGTTIANVQFLDNGAPIGQATLMPYHAYTLAWSPNDPAGSYTTHTITAQATDSLGNTGSSGPITLTIGAELETEVGVTKGALVFNHQPPYTYTTELAITNNGATAISGPIQVLLTGLPQGVSLSNKTSRLSGAPGPGPYVTLSNSSLAPGQTIGVPLILLDPARTPIGYTGQVYTGVF